ncbi:MAG TPA: outer membrane lipoprotein carrier protein LolA [Verrucomicrobiae bacterium]|nr:outer membrane lipoprotein carrier protein LolA [Verrucomicrobiae bacterium]
MLVWTSQKNELLFGAEQPDALLAQFEARYREARSLSATFLEEYSENGKVTRKEAGKSYFLHPGKMRWDYEAPEKNTFLADGKFVWFITPEDHTATRMPAKKSEDWRTPLAFLTDGIKLSRICAAVEWAADVSPRQAGYKVYRCELRGAKDADSNPKGIGKEGGAAKAQAAKGAGSVLFELSPVGELSRILIDERAGIQVEFMFKDWQWNPVLPKALFQFVAQPGMVIVNGLLPDSPALRQ